MLFYKITADNDGAEFHESTEQCQHIKDNSEKLFNNSQKKCFAVPITIEKGYCEIAAMVKAEVVYEYTPEKIVEIIGDMNGWHLYNVRSSEQCKHYFTEALEEAQSKSYIINRKRIFSDVNINLHLREDDHIAKNISRDNINKIAENLLYEKSMIPEIDRIYAQKNTSNRNFHPAHYMIKSDDDNDYTEIIDCLISALHENGRLMSARYTQTKIYTVDFVSEDDLLKLYEVHIGGTVVLRLYPESKNDAIFLRNSPIKNMKTAIKVINKYRDKTLTIIVLPLGNTKESGILYQDILSPLVEIYPQNASNETVKQNLIHRADRAGFEYDDELLNIADENKDRTFTSQELNEHFERWRQKKTTAMLYPQYLELSNIRPANTESGNGTALNTLNNMIGLSAAKDIIYKALDFYKVQRLYRSFGKQREVLSMHMVFTGSPGTAKTTTARLFAQILKDNDILTKGNLVEVGRGDLVGKYVGHTAPLVKNVFEKARGGVLFIDEAYSLLDDKNNLYGDEAINTIVQEMENNRDETIVIFAGYTNEMEQFLDRNPGLHSRIAFHVPFEDYTPQELVDIAELMSRNKGNKITPEAHEKLLGIFGSAVKSKNFGNGRFVRNIMEKAEMNRASRIVKMDASQISKDELETFLADDFEYTLPKTIKNGIGFVV